MITIVYSVVIAFAAAGVTTYFLSKSNGWFQILDHPNERSLHTTPVPRTGGLGIWAGMVAGSAVALSHFEFPVEVLWYAIAMTIVGVISFADDRTRVPVIVRFVTHVAAALLLVTAGYSLSSLPIAAVTPPIGIMVVGAMSALFVVWMTNLYNFMDGIDGFAGGMAVIGFATFAALGAFAGDILFASINAIIAASAGAFLIFNFPPARVFMGDVGSSVLGFAAGANMLWADNARLFPIWVGLLVFSPFIVDATTTLIRRMWRGEKFWLPHRTHYYQRLVQSGWGHRKTTLFGYGLMSVCAGSALALQRLDPTLGWAIIISWAITYIALARFVDRTTRKGANAAS